jgi:glycosyltransferase involved in cell wall biosynthesis
LRIFIVEPYTRTAGHYDRLAVRTGEALTRLGNEVTLVSYGGIEDNLLEDRAALAVVDAAPKGERHLDARYCDGKLDFTSFRSFVKRMSREFRIFRFALSRISQREPSVVHFYDADPLPLTLAMLTTRKHKDKRSVFIITVHEASRLRFSSDEAFAISASRRMKRRIYRWLYRKLLGRLIARSLNGVTVFDPAVKEALVNQFKIDETAADRICVLPHGAGDPIEPLSKAEARKRLGLNVAETIFLIFGVLRKDKRIDLAIEAMKEVPSCRLIIAGGEQDLTDPIIKELIARHGCERFVSTDIGYISEEKMHNYFFASDAVVIPYAGSFRGASGILAMACGHGRSVIASDVGILGSTVKQYKIGFTVQPDSASALRQGILRFLSLVPEDRQRMEAQALSFAYLHNWDSVSLEAQKFYRKLLEREIRS